MEADTRTGAIFGVWLDRTQLSAKLKSANILVDNPPNLIPAIPAIIIMILCFVTMNMRQIP